MPVLLPGKLLPLSLHSYLVWCLVGYGIIGLFVLTRPISPIRSVVNAAEHELCSSSLVALPTIAPLIFLLVWLSVNLWSSADRITSWIAIGYLLFGIVLYMWGVSAASLLFYQTHLPLGITLIGTTLALILPLIVIWKPQFRLFYLPLYDRLQTIQLDIGETVHPNILAGVLVLTVPTALSLFAWQSTYQRLRYLQLGLLISTIVQLSVLILSQSRGGYLALTAAMVTMLLLRWPRLIYLLPVVMVSIALLTRSIGWTTILDQFSSDSALGGWSGRLEIWQTSLMAIANFPFTGIGIGTFTTVIPLLYPLSFPIESYPHAHNLFLQVALDLGIPGLIAYIALLINLFAMLFVTLRKAPRHTMVHTLAIGATGSLVGMITHGMLDAVTWGTKLSFIPWLLFALITQLFLQVQQPEPVTDQLQPL
ncbi:MAG: O-antigen ligase family protein [Caldilineaceae bacterium]